MELLELPDNERMVKLAMDKVMERTEPDLKMPADTAVFILQQIVGADKRKTIAAKVKRFASGTWGRVAAAAVIIAIVTTIVYTVSTGGHKEKQMRIATVEDVIHPGEDKALLTLADGSVVYLNEMPDGALQQGDYTIKKEGSVLQCNAGSAGSGISSAGAFNILSTPRGGQFQLVLPDGSKVWLNAESSLKFPVVFDKRLREVELTGEAYFEIKSVVSQNGKVKMPFDVVVNLPLGKQAKVHVLGTHFNVNAYNNEVAMNTTLIEGAVNVSEGGQHVALRPGQQARIAGEGSLKVVAHADTEKAVAWKNGLFHFDDVDVATIMRQISRWYDVEIVYAGNVPARHFVGKIRRSAELSEVLEILRLSDIGFKVNGKTIIVQ